MPSFVFSLLVAALAVFSLLAAAADAALPPIVTAGRFDTRSMPGSLRWDWSYVRFSVHVECDRASSVSQIDLDFLLHDQGNQYAVEIVTSDGRVLGTQVLKVATDARATRTYTISFASLAGKLDGAPFRVVVTKRTEALFGTAELLDLGVRTQAAAAGAACRFVKAASAVSAKSDGQRAGAADALASMEFIGDSLTCGYGALGEMPCHFSPDTEDVAAGFAVQTARKLGVAQTSVVCWSGKGVVRNYGSANRTSPDPFPIFYNRTLANEQANLWSFKEFVPSMVVLNLEANDFSTQPWPTYDEFATGYNQLLDRIQGYYGKDRVKIVATCLRCHENVVQLIVKRRADPRVYFVSMANSFNPQQPGMLGCDYHPSSKAADLMSNVLAAGIKKILLG